MGLIFPIGVKSGNCNFGHVDHSTHEKHDIRLLLLQYFLKIILIGILGLIPPHIGQVGKLRFWAHENSDLYQILFCASVLNLNVNLKNDFDAFTGSNSSHTGQIEKLGF